MIVELPVSRNFPSGQILDSFTIILESISPERKEELHNLTANVTFSITDGPEWKCEAISNYELIAVSRKTIEIIWAFCYSYYDIYSKSIAGQAASGQQINLNNHDLGSARKLLTWAMNNLKGEEVNEIPDDCPKPSDRILWGSTGHVALELMLATIAFYLHHELAHIRVKDKSFDKPILEEQECDRLAVEWILNKCPANAFDKRVFGIATGLSLMNALGTHTKDFDGRQHPFSYNRLIENLEKNVNPDNDKVWGWVIAILSIHFHENKMPLPQEQFANFYECVKAYKTIMEEHGNRITAVE